MTILLNQYISESQCLIFCFVFYFKRKVPYYFVVLFSFLFYILHSMWPYFLPKKHALLPLSFTLNVHGCLPFFPSGVASNLLIPSGSNVCKPLSMYFLFHCLLCLFLQCHYSLLWDIFLSFCFAFFPPEIQSGDLKKQQTPQSTFPNYNPDPRGFLCYN